MTVKPDVPTPVAPQEAPRRAGVEFIPIELTPERLAAARRFWGAMLKKITDEQSENSQAPPD